MINCDLNGMESMKLEILENLFVWNIVVVNDFMLLIAKIADWNSSFYEMSANYEFIRVNQVLIMAGKFLLLIGFLILIRGGTPRYRYDFLTKLGWFKFLSMTVWLFLAINILIYLN